MGLFALFRRRPHERAGFELYGHAVAAARSPVLFGRLGVPDTLEGRFDMVSLHVALLIRRLHRDPDKRGPALAQAVFDAMFSDMDLNLREMGVGDLSVGKRVRHMWEAFHGRANAYEQALRDEDQAALATALERNIWAGEAPDSAATRLAALARVQAAHLADQPLADLLRGRARFRPAEEVLDAA